MADFNLTENNQVRNNLVIFPNEYLGVIYCDNSSLITGTSGYPNGTALYPIKYLDDAGQVAYNYGIETVIVKEKAYFNNDYKGPTAHSGAISGARYFKGYSPSVYYNNLVYLENKIIDLTTFENVNIMSMPNSDSYGITLKNCLITSDIISLGKYYIIDNCILNNLSTAIIRPAPGQSFNYIRNSGLIKPNGNFVTFDCSDWGTGYLNINNCYGYLEIINLSGFAPVLNINNFSGIIKIDETCTNGHIEIQGGKGNIIDSSSGTSVIVSGFVYDTQLTAQNIWEYTPRGLTQSVSAIVNTPVTVSAIYSDVKVGVSGTMPAVEITNPVAVSANNDKTNYSLDATTLLNIKTKVDEALISYDTSGGVAKESSVLSIQNNTNFVASIADYYLIPNSGYNVYKLRVCLYDNDGNMEDPDSDDLGIQVSTPDGTLKNTLMYKNYAVTSALDDSVISGHKQLVKESTGIYYGFIKIASTESITQFMYDFAFLENSVQKNYTRTNLLLESNPATVDANVVSIENNVITSASIASDAINAIQSGLAKALDLSAVQLDIDNIQTRLPNALINGKIDSIVTDPVSVSALSAGLQIGVSANNDKTGYNVTSLASGLKIGTSGDNYAEVTNQVAVSANYDKTGYSIIANSDKQGYSIINPVAVSAAYAGVAMAVSGIPDVNLASAAAGVKVGVSGTMPGVEVINQVAVSANNDKTGYSITANSDKDGYTITNPVTVSAISSGVNIGVSGVVEIDPVQIQEITGVTSSGVNDILSEVTILATDTEVSSGVNSILNSISSGTNTTQLSIQQIGSISGDILTSGAPIEDVLIKDIDISNDIVYITYKGPDGILKVHQGTFAQDGAIATGVPY